MGRVLSIVVAMLSIIVLIVPSTIAEEEVHEDTVVLPWGESVEFLINNTDIG